MSLQKLENEIQARNKHENEKQASFEDFMQKQKKVGELLIEALDLINELDENIGIETNNSFTMDFEELRKKITNMIGLRR